MAEIQRPEGAIRSRRIKGRGQGSGNGKTSGKGHKGQNARSGGGVRPGFEGGQMPLYRRIARRGFSNFPFKKKVFEVSLRDLQEAYADGETVDMATLSAKKLIGRNVQYVKILVNGELSRKLTVSGIAVSAGARSAIEAAGGTINENGTE